MYHSWPHAKQLWHENNKQKLRYYHEYSHNGIKGGTDLHNIQYDPEWWYIMGHGHELKDHENMGASF